MALGDVLDIVSPYNVIELPNWVTTYILPSSKGKTISNRMLHSMFKLILEDIP